MLRLFRSRARHGLRAVSCSVYLMISPALAAVPSVPQAGNPGGSDAAWSEHQPR